MATKRYRAKADKGWSKTDIYSYMKVVLSGLIEDDEVTLFPISKLLDKDCRWFADLEFEIDAEYEEDECHLRDDLAIDLFNRVAKRNGISPVAF